MNTKKLILAIGGLIFLILFAAGFIYFSRLKTENPKKKIPVGAAGAAGQVSKNVPEIVTNPAAKAPEVNPLYRANPFKYSNPLR